MYLLSEDDVVHIHDLVLNPGELTGQALDKPLAGALSRIDFRLSYGLIVDAYELAASYAVVLATGHLFNDGNKRTAFRSMDVVLRLHDIPKVWETEATGQKIIATAQSQIDEIELANWLRCLP